MAEAAKAIQSEEVPNQFTIFNQVTSDSGIIQAMTAVSQIVNTKILTVKNDDQEREYTELLVQARTITKNVEIRRKAIVDPLNRAVRAVNDWLKTHISGPIESKEGEIRNALTVYRRKKEEEARKQQEKANALQARMQAEAEAKGMDIPVPQIVTPAPEKIVRTGSGGQVHERKEFKVEVTDLKALIGAVAAEKVPMNVLQADMPAIRKLAQGGLEMPGVKAGYETTLAVRGA